MFAVVASSCGSDRETGASENSGSTVEQSASQSQNRALPSTDRWARGGAAHISQGTIDVFGLRIPGGMTPTAGPYKVYRFEGTHHVSQVVNYIRDQVSADKVQPEGDGFIMRYARVRNSKDKISDDMTLAIRMYPRATGGSVLDIWQEREQKNALPGRAPSFYKGATGKRIRSEVAFTPYRAQQQRSFKETMRTIKKLQTHERLDSNDLRSPFFESE
jgi:hypothetical protein